MNAHSRGLHREHARPGQPIFLSGRRRHGASTFFLGVAGMARPLSAGRARNTDGTHPRASSGARSAVSGPFPEVLLPAWRRASSARDRTDPTERSRSRPGRRWGRRHAALRNPGRAGRAFVGPPNRSASIEPISSVPTSYCQGPSGRVGALAPRSRIARPGVRGHLSHHLISGSS